MRKYEELKSKNVRNLDPLVYLLSKLCEDKEVQSVTPSLDLYINHPSDCTFFAVASLQALQFLQQNAKERSESSANTTTTTSYTLPQTSSKMSMQELEELRKKLGNVTASSNAPLVSFSSFPAF